MEKVLTKVSVIIPVYNVEKYLRECLDSISNQTLKDIEIICINDGSTDKSLGILEEYAEKDSRILVISQENQGAGNARNKGIEVAQGEFLAILDSDDVYKRNMLETMYNKSICTDADIVICKSEEMDNKSGIINLLENSLKTDYLPQKEVFNYRDVSKKVFNFCMGWSWDKLYKSSFIKEFGLKFQDLKNTNDAYFVFMSVILASKITYVEDILVTHRVNTGKQLSETREQECTCFIKTIKHLKNKMNELGLYKEVEQSFLNWAIGFSIWNINSINGLKQKNKLAKIVKDELIEDLKILEKDENYFYKISDYKKMLKIDTLGAKFKRALNSKFSFKNSRDKSYKIITLCGIEFKFRRRQYA